MTFARALALRFVTGAAPPVLAALLCAGPGPCRADAQGDELKQMLQTLADRHHVCAVVVARVEKRELRGVQWASGCSPPPALSADSVFEAASLGKPVFAYAVLELAAQGRLSLDAPLLSYLPHGYVHRQNPFDDEHGPRTDLVGDPRLGQVTARQVLSHTSGLPNWSRGPLRFDAAPGTTWRYSGEGYVLLQRAVEAITGETLDAFMRTQLFGPVGMQHTDYVWRHEQAAAFVPTFAADRAISPRHFTEPFAATTLYTSATDYGRFLATVLGDAEALQTIVSAPVPVDAGLNLRWGLGWAIEQVGDDRFIWHWGSNAGYRSFVIASLRTGDGLVMLTDSNDGLRLAQPLTEALLPGRHDLFRFFMLHDGPVPLRCRMLNQCSQ